MKRYDGIALAGALGALAGLSVAVVNAWEILPTILSAVVCMGVAGVAYRPLEVLMVVVSACRALPGAVRSMPEWLRVRKEQLQKGIRATLFVIGCIALTLLSALAIPMLLYLGGVLPHILNDRGDAIGVVVRVFCTTALLLGVGMLVFFYLLVVCNEKSPPWAFRVGKACHGIFDMGLGDGKKTGQEDSELADWTLLLFCFCFPILTELASIGVVVVVLDAFSTLLLALASTERIAAVLGGVLGWGTAVLLHVLGAPGDLFLLAIGGAVGWYAGPLLYRLRAYLSRVPVVETV